MFFFQFHYSFWLVRTPVFRYPQFMDKLEITAYIIDQLGRSVKLDDLLYDVCQKANTTWPEAEQLVRQIQSENHRLIVRKQFPLQFILALAIFIGGLIFLAYGTFLIVTQIGLVNEYVGSVVNGNPEIDAIQKISVTFLAVYHLGFTPLASEFLGAALVLGSLIGMREVWAEILWS
jgi:hypothetical protein